MLLCLPEYSLRKISNTSSFHVSMGPGMHQCRQSWGGGLPSRPRLVFLFGSRFRYGPGCPSWRYEKTFVISMNFIFDLLVFFFTARSNPNACFSCIIFVKPFSTSSPSDAGLTFPVQDPPCSSLHPHSDRVKSCGQW